jgi:hypothetical protein
MPEENEENHAIYKALVLLPSPPPPERVEVNKKA